MEIFLVGARDPVRDSVRALLPWVIQAACVLVGCDVQSMSSVHVLFDNSNCLHGQGAEHNGLTIGALAHFDSCQAFAGSVFEEKPEESLSGVKLQGRGCEGATDARRRRMSSSRFPRAFAAARGG